MTGGGIYVKGFRGSKPLPEKIIIERMFARTKLNGECLEYLGSKTTGYGSVGWKGKNELTHRVAYINKYGNIPKGMWVLHKCDNRACINISHLFLGTPKDNTQDMISKGRQKHLSVPNDIECRNGHKRTIENTYNFVNKKGLPDRHCKTCKSIFQTKNKEKINESQRIRRMATARQKRRTSNEE